MTFKLALVAAATLFLGLSSAHAGPVTSNPTIVDGGITFDAFTGQVTVQGNATPGNASAIDVSMLPTADGLRFTSGFTALSPGGAGSTNSFADALIRYRATSAQSFSSVSLSFDASFFGLAIGSVTETVYADPARSLEIGSAKVECGVLVGCNRNVTILLNGSYDTIYVTKDINVTSFSSGGLSQISVVDQAFTLEAPRPIPEPETYTLVAGGLGVMALMSRRRRQD